MAEDPQLQTRCPLAQFESLGCPLRSCTKHLGALDMPSVQPSAETGSVCETGAQTVCTLSCQ